MRKFVLILEGVMIFFMSYALISFLSVFFFSLDNGLGDEFPLIILIFFASPLLFVCFSICAFRLQIRTPVVDYLLLVLVISSCFMILNAWGLHSTPLKAMASSSIAMIVIFWGFLRVRGLKGTLADQP
jgi:hypothetical protein